MARTVRRRRYEVTHSYYRSGRRDREAKINGKDPIRLLLDGKPVRALFDTGGDWGHDSNIGYGFMRNYVVTFDYPNKLITFERPSSLPAQHSALRSTFCVTGVNSGFRTR